MKYKIIIFLIILTSCSSEMENLIIEGKISGVKNSKIYLSNVEEGKIIDSTNVIDGEFKLPLHIMYMFPLITEFELIVILPVATIYPGPLTVEFDIVRSLLTKSLLSL